MTAGLSRRRLLAGGGALMVSVSLAHPDEPPLPGSLKETPLLDAWIRVGPDGAITAFSGKAELGQGLKTALTQVVAEQLDVSPARVTLVTADTARTPNEGFTAGSHSMQDSGTALMHAAAQTRLLLLDAAAGAMGVTVDMLTVSDGMIHAPGGGTRDYGSLAAGLSTHVRAQPSSALKNPASYRVMGTAMPRVDIPVKVSGGAAYVQDMRPDGMLHARAIRQPSAGAELTRADTDTVAKMPSRLRH
jgi:nicotinate dehydrogenase subunit B